MPKKSKTTSTSKALSFYDLKAKKKFKSSKYKMVTKKTKRGKVNFAVTDAPSGIKSWRIVSRG